MGFMGINVPEAMGDKGFRISTDVIALEELARISSAVAMPVFEANFGPMAVLTYFASEGAKAADFAARLSRRMHCRRQHVRSRKPARRLRICAQKRKSKAIALLSTA